MQSKNLSSPGDEIQGARAFEWPTWCLMAVIYGGFAALTYYHQRIPVWLLALLGGWFVCWHSQLQHECIHGHPTRWQWLNDLLVLPSLWLWLPYPIYAESHRRHHATLDLTIPGLDPESFYWAANSWRQAGAFARSIASINQTLCGRMLLGPLLSVLALIKAELGLLARGDFRHLGHWIMHVLAMAPLLYWLVAVCEISLLKYLLCFALPGTSLALVRSFCEHVPARSRAERTRTVEDNGPLAWLFLFNNLHVLHHRRPEIPWYALAAIYAANGSGYLRQGGTTPIASYGEVFRRYFWRTKDSPVSPIS